MDREKIREAIQAITEKPNPARVYDYLLGGGHNFPADQEAAEQLLTAFPEIGRNARLNRAFLGRAVRFLLEQGIDQFLDIGSGLPTAGAVHQIAQGANPAARVVYVDHDPVVIHHSREILAGNLHATAVRLDVRDTEAVLDHPEVRRLLDFERPIAVLLVALFHFMPDDVEAHRVSRRLRAALSPDSYVVLSHMTDDGLPNETDEAVEVYRRSTAQFRPRSRAEVLSLLDGLDLVDPGLVYAPLWHPESAPRGDPGRSANWVGVGRKI